ncbi:MAG: hypothetical protein ACLQUY_28345 [Ktedonobacterales bacterium]
MSDEQPTLPLPRARPSGTHYGQSPARHPTQPPIQQYPVQPQFPDSAQAAQYRSTPTIPPHHNSPSYTSDRPEPNFPTRQRPLQLRNWTALGIMATLGLAAVALICISVLAFAGAKGHASVKASPKLTHTSSPTSTIHSTESSTAEPGTQAIIAPVLGGTVSDFTRQFGLPEGPTNNEAGSWQQITLAGQPVSLTVSTAPPQDSQDGELHVMNVIVETTPNVTWSSTTQQQIMAVFLPSDAKFERQISTGVGSERIYTSAHLAATFTASLFTDQTDSQTVAPGTFDEQCFLGGNGVQSGGAANTCELTLGIVY